jgi:uncharacterized protein (TIGR03086 family)
MDLIEQYRRSVAGFTERLAQIGPEQWSAPTPCTEWDVRALVNHVVNEERWMPPLFGGATIAEVGDRFDGDLLGDDPLGNAADAAREADAAVAAPGAMERTVHLSFGDFPAGEYFDSCSWTIWCTRGTWPRPSAPTGRSTRRSCPR